MTAPVKPGGTIAVPVELVRDMLGLLDHDLRATTHEWNYDARLRFWLEGELRKVAAAQGMKLPAVEPGAERQGGVVTAWRWIPDEPPPQRRRRQQGSAGRAGGRW